MGLVLVSIWARGSIGTTKPSFCSDLTCRKLCPKEYYSLTETAFSSSFLSPESSPASIVSTYQSTSPVFLLNAISKSTNLPVPALDHWAHFLSSFPPYLRLSSNLDVLIDRQVIDFVCKAQSFLVSFSDGPNMNWSTPSAPVHWQIKNYLRTILNVFPGFRSLDFINTHDWFCFYEFLPTYPNQQWVATWDWQETRFLSSRDFVIFLFSWQAR